MDYNWWDDRTEFIDINPCKGCEDYVNGECVSNGGCGGDIMEQVEDSN